MASVAATTDEPLKKLPAARWGSLPSRMRVLFITTEDRPGSSVAEALASDSASEVTLVEAVGVIMALDRLRDEVFDALLISHEPDQLDALELIEGLRAGGSAEPMLVLGSSEAEEMTALCYEVGADAYLNFQRTTTRTMLWTLARAVERHQLLRENRRQAQSERQRLHQEHQEADRLLAQQRALITDLESLGALHVDSGDAAEPDDEQRRTVAVASAEPFVLPEPLIAHYRQLLRAYVIMGSGNLTDEMTTLADLLASAGVTAQQAMLLHLGVLEELIRGMGSRSARHVMSRADLLGLEVMIHLAEGYRQRYFERLCPPRQQLLPGFVPPAAQAAS